MRFTANTHHFPQWILISLATLVLILTDLALVWATGTPASVQ